MAIINGSTPVTQFTKETYLINVRRKWPVNSFWGN